MEKINISYISYKKEEKSLQNLIYFKSFYALNSQDMQIESYKYVQLK